MGYLFFSVDLEEFHSWYSFEITKFSSRIFGIVDLDGSGDLNFTEFVVGLWNFLTFDRMAITKFVFDIFDVDKKEHLTEPECDALVRMLYNQEEVSPEIKEVLRVMDADGDGKVTAKEYLDYTAAYPMLMKPAFTMHATLRRKFLGNKAWEEFVKFRAETYGEFETIENILISKRKQDKQEKQRKEEEQKKQVEMTQLELEGKKKKDFEREQKRILEEEQCRRDAMTTEDKKYEELKIQLDTLKADIESSKMSEDSDHLTKQRKQLKKLIPSFVKAHEATFSSLRKRLQDMAMESAEVFIVEIVLLHLAS
jgi:Ca2+-binding EF-hand superfamily protein